MVRNARHRSLAARLGALASLISGLLGLEPAAAARAQSISPAQAPLAWVHFAEHATRMISAWLEEDSEAAARFRTYLHQVQAAGNQPIRPLEIKLWITPDGLIERVAFAPFVHEQANADLRAAIVGRRLPSAPPPDMLLPLRIAVQLEHAGEQEVVSESRMSAVGRPVLSLGHRLAPSKGAAGRLEARG